MIQGVSRCLARGPGGHSGSLGSLMKIKGIIVCQEAAGAFQAISEDSGEFQRVSGAFYGIS